MSLSALLLSQVSLPSLSTLTCFECQVRTRVNKSAQGLRRFPGTFLSCREKCETSSWAEDRLETSWGPVRTPCPPPLLVPQPCCIIASGRTVPPGQGCWQQGEACTVCAWWLAVHSLREQCLGGWEASRETLSGLEVSHHQWYTVRTRRFLLP